MQKYTQIIYSFPQWYAILSLVWCTALGLDTNDVIVQMGYMIKLNSSYAGEMSVAWPIQMLD